jgi:glucose/mannose-6-phosphate isomerase
VNASPASKLPLGDLAYALPEHLLLGADRAGALQGLPQRGEIETIVIFGMGTGKTAGEVVRAVGGAKVPVPILVESAYEVPGCVGARSLVFALSGSGNTDEVNHAAATSSARGARLVAISAGGWLLDFAADSAAAIVPIPAEIKPPRATFGVVVGALLATLERTGFLPEARPWLESAALQLGRRRDELSRDGNFAERLASDLVARHVTCQGDTPIGATAAERWKAQINQNARQSASASAQPNASHNEAVAWDCRNDLTRTRDAFVMLRHGFEDPRVSQRMARLSDYLDGKIPVHSVRGEGGSPFAVLMDLAMIADFTSLHLAVKNGVNPGSAPFISHTVKEGLAVPKPLSKTTGR